MSNLKDYLKTTIRIGEKIKAFSFFTNEDYVKLSDETDTILTRATYPELSAKYPTGKYANAQLQDTINNPSVLGSSEAFGSEGMMMSGDGSRLVIAKHQADSPTLLNCGYISVFRNDSGTWVEEITTNGNAAAVNRFFGRTVAIDYTGTRIAVYGNTNTAEGGATEFSSGEVEIWRRSGTTWSYEATIKKPANGNGTSGDDFGKSLSFDKDADWLLIGAESYTVTEPEWDVGRVFLYHRRNDNSWNKSQTIGNPNNVTLDAFGRSLSMSHDAKTIVVGANAVDSPYSINSGAVYVFDRTSNIKPSDPAGRIDVFTMTQEMFPPREFDEDNLYFSSYDDIGLSADGRTLVVPMLLLDRTATIGTEAGGLMVYKRERQSTNDQSNSKYTNGHFEPYDDNVRSTHTRLPWGFFQGFQYISGYYRHKNSEQMGYNLCISGDGNTIIAYARTWEPSAVGFPAFEADSGAVYVFRTQENFNGGQKNAYFLDDYIPYDQNLQVTNYGYFGDKIAIDYHGNTIAAAYQSDGTYLSEGTVLVYSYVDESATDLRFPRQYYPDNICNFVKVK